MYGSASAQLFVDCHGGQYSIAHLRSSAAALAGCVWRNAWYHTQAYFPGRVKNRKSSCIFVNAHIREALLAYRKSLCTDGVMTEQREVGGQFLFCGKDGSPISRVQAYRIIRKAAEQCQLPGTISPHSMRKTFGYHAWKQGIPPVLLMEIYHHSSFTITKRYLGIDQDDRDEVFKNICL